MVHDLPGVGKNLQDHPDYVFNYRAKSLDLLGISLGGGLQMMKEIGRYRRERTGMMTSNGAEGLASGTPPVAGAALSRS